MSVMGYALNLALVALVVRQVHGKRLTAWGLAWPVAAVVLAGAKYLRGVPTAGNDLALVVLGGVVGALLGTLCGLLTRIRPENDGVLVAKATGAAAALWVLGIGSRIVFALYAENGGGVEIARWSARHAIIGATAWTDCLVLMSLAEVVARTVSLGARAVTLQRSHANSPPPSEHHEPPMFGPARRG